MKKGNRYKTSHLSEDQYEDGSRGLVLKNLRGIKQKREIDLLEAKEQLRVLKEVVMIYDEMHQFTASDICYIHKVWLEKIYSWAGTYRVVNISKGGFSFAMCRQIPNLMDQFEKEYLKQHTPCRYSSNEEIAKALAIIHVELILVHPFREGNGRLARILSILMALQAGLPGLDFGGVQGRKKKEYIAAIHAGVSRDYQPMSKIFLSVIKRTIKNFSSEAS